MEEEISRSVAVRLAESAASRDGSPSLEEIAREQLTAGVTREQLLGICNLARDLCRTEAAEDAVLDLMDRLTGYTRPEYRI